MRPLFHFNFIGGVMYTNRGNISLSMAVWLASDDYDLRFDPKVISVTDLLQPIRSLILTRRLKEKQVKSSVDIAELIPSRLGSAVHTAVEVAWLDNREKAMKLLGIPQNQIDRIRLNADNQDDPNAIYIYIERRNSIEMEGFTVSGRFDIVDQGMLEDVKTTKTYSWIKGTNNERYRYQGSMYRLINPDIITNDFMNVQYMFTDWSPYQAQANKDYPQKRVMAKRLKLLSLKDTEFFMRTKLQEIKKHQVLKQEELPNCTPEELWQDPPKWAYYKDKTKTVRATKLFDSAAEATSRNAADGAKGKIVKRDAEPTFCKYCDARPICTQAEYYIAEGLLQL